nr:MAG TPA: hypothetical protein [Caudoviricetes sp.]DAY52303.1 MAG TPA: hypothetical protein [Caudoviricetes sp.]
MLSYCHFFSFLVGSLIFIKSPLSRRFVIAPCNFHIKNC